MSYPFNLPPFIHIRVPQPEPDVQPHRPHPKQPHGFATVAKVRQLVETTGMTLKEIDRRTGVNHGTISRWILKHGWTRPSHAFPTKPAGCRVEGDGNGRQLATRLRVQAERMMAHLEASDAVTPEEIRFALNLLIAVRREQARRRLPQDAAPDPDPQPLSAAALDEAAPDAAPVSYRRPPRVPKLRLDAEGCPLPPRPPATWDRSEAARRGWGKRYAKLGRVRRVAPSPR
ncbi:MAG TPA: hypothetical protein VIL65_12010 [Beijerinckiaceae bacterium]